MVTIVNDGPMGEALVRSRNADNSDAFFVIMESILGCPARAKLLRNEHPYNGSLSEAELNAKLQNRVFRITHDVGGQFLSGPNLKVLTKRYVDSLMDGSALGDIGKEWIHMPDLACFIRDAAFRAGTEALFGTTIFSLTPNLCDLFWNFEYYMRVLSFGLPRWLVPRAYLARDRMIQAMESSHRYACKHSSSSIRGDDPDWDSIFGSRYRKRRDAFFSGTEFGDEHSLACVNVALLVATSSNSIPTATWTVLHTLLDSQLVDRARKEIDPCVTPRDGATSHVDFDIEKLTSSPLLQSMFAETMRLRTANLVVRTPRQNIQSGPYNFTKGRMIMISAAASSLDPRLWNDGTESEPHPLKTFWADRFLAYPHDPHSGPLNHDRARDKEASVEAKLDGPRFTTNGLGGEYMPFGGGTSVCPGRHFAKNQVICGLAVLLALFDFELCVPAGFQPQPNVSYYGFGTMPVKDKIPFRIRRRHQTPCPPMQAKTKASLL